MGELALTLCCFVRGCWAGTWSRVDWKKSQIPTTFLGSASTASQRILAPRWFCTLPVCGRGSLCCCRDTRYKGVRQELKAQRNVWRVGDVR